MHVGKRYTNIEVLFWTRRNIYKLTIISLVPVLLYDVCGLHWIALPWTVVALLGTATAFIVGFRNSQTYNRTWEARQIWGGVVNSSRAFGIAARDFIQDPNKQRLLIYRHIAWMTALRYAMREPRGWETMSDPKNVEYQKKNFTVPERDQTLEQALSPHLSTDELRFILQTKNKATQLLALQSKSIAEWTANGEVSELRFIEYQRLLKDLYDVQGKSERIKNFPYPRQFATVNGMLVQFFIYLLPFCMLREFDRLKETLSPLAAEHVVWLVVPFSVLISWVFTSLDQIGESTENPFEGNANDVPISQISRNIEIDLLEMIGHQPLPEPIAARNSIVL
ncbi:MAG TPA: bestrophin family ion channel [Luteibaculaceae bacterium]|nr:bestrophin family ion channel [Luteibaculaceae bacterium]